MNELFNEFFNLLVSLEGGFSNVKGDKGGKTKYGVTEYLLNSVKDKYQITNSIENLTKDDAYKIYYGEYFKPIHVVDNKESYYLYFDLCVNSGYGNYKECYIKTDANDPQTIYDWRKEFFNDDVKKNPSQKKFLSGWLNRLKLIEKHFMRR